MTSRVSTNGFISFQEGSKMAPPGIGGAGGRSGRARGGGAAMKERPGTSSGLAAP